MRSQRYERAVTSGMCRTLDACRKTRVASHQDMHVTIFLAATLEVDDLDREWADGQRRGIALAARHFSNMRWLGSTLRAAAPSDDAQWTFAHGGNGPVV